MGTMKLVVFRSFGLLLIAALAAFSMSSCADVAMTRELNALDRAYAKGEISESEYKAQRPALASKLANHEAMVTALMSGASGHGNVPSGGAGQYIYVQASPHVPKGGYVPQAVSRYVQSPQRQPRQGYRPSPQMRYVNAPRPIPQTSTQPTAAPRYVQTLSTNAPVAFHQSPPPQLYVSGPQHSPKNEYFASPEPRYVPTPSNPAVPAQNLPKQQLYVQSPSKPASKSAASTVPKQTQYDLSGRPIDLTKAEQERRSNENMKKTVKTTGTVGGLIKDVASGNLVGAAKKVPKVIKQGINQAKDFNDPTKNTGLLPPSGPAPAPLPAQVQKDLEEAGKAAKK